MDSTLIYHYTPYIRINFIKLVSLDFILTRDRVKSTTSRSPIVMYLMGLAYILKMMLNPLITHTLAHTWSHTRTRGHTHAHTYVITWLVHTSLCGNTPLPGNVSCHMSAQYKNDFFNFKNPYKSKINSEKFRKFITFKIHLQIDPNLFC